MSKYFVLSAFCVSLLSFSNAMALNCVTADNQLVKTQETVVLYYASQPRTQIGPGYTCAQVSRVRTCEFDGQFSNIPVECSQSDSGGCADGWLARLSDTAFTFFNCKD